MRTGNAAAVEVETVKRHPFDQFAARLRLKGRDRRIAQFAIGLPITFGDAEQQPLVDIEHLLDGFVPPTASFITVRLLGEAA